MYIRHDKVHRDDTYKKLEEINGIIINLVFKAAPSKKEGLGD